MATSVVEDPNRPMPGIVLRPATLTDCEAVVDLLNVCARRLYGHNEFSVDGLRSEWTQPGFDLSTSSLLAIHGGDQIVGYCDIWDMQTPPLKPFLFGRTHPDFEGRGIGTALLTWGEERARQAIKRAPAEAQVSLVAATRSGHAPTIDLLQNNGFASTRYSLEMTIDLPAEPPAVDWPSDFRRMRQTEFGDLHTFYRAYRDAWQDHRGWVEQDEALAFPLWQHRVTTDPEYDPSLWFLALDGDEVAGVALCKRLREEDPDLGWVEMLAVRRPWRRRGVGLALLQTAFAEFAQRGLRRVGLSVDANSLTGATRLYQRAGMTVKEEHTILEKELRRGVDLSKQ